MKSVTEFAKVILTKGLNAKAALEAEKKTPEEIQQSLGETFKFEEEKLKHFINAMEVASQNPEHLKRVLVQSFSEGEATPAKALKVEEMHYVPDFLVDPKRVPKKKDDGKGGRGKGRKDNDRSR